MRYTRRVMALCHDLARLMWRRKSWPHVSHRPLSCPRAPDDVGPPHGNRVATCAGRRATRIVLSTSAMLMASSRLLTPACVRSPRPWGARGDAGGRHGEGRGHPTGRAEQTYAIGLVSLQLVANTVWCAFVSDKNHT